MKNFNPDHGLEYSRRRLETTQGKTSATPRQNFIWFLVFLLLIAAIVLFVTFVKFR